MPAVLSFKLHYLYFPEYHDKYTDCISLMSSVLSKFHVLYFPENHENIYFSFSTFTVYIFQNIMKRRDINLISVLVSKFPVKSFTYNVLQNITIREFHIIHYFCFKQASSFAVYIFQNVILGVAFH